MRGPVCLQHSKNDQFHAEKVIHFRNHDLIYFTAVSGGARSFFVVGAGRGTIIGIGLALVGPIGITSGCQDMSMMGQPIELPDEPQVASAR
jgi:hypothetical protein